jgi:hypothetical protein
MSPNVTSGVFAAATFILANLAGSIAALNISSWHS